MSRQEWVGDPNIDKIIGHMAIAMFQMSLERKLSAAIPQIVLFYPVTDTFGESETYKTFKNGPYLAAETMNWMINAFLPREFDRKHALTSPLEYASDEVLAKFPSTTIFVSSADPLIGEGEQFGHRLQKLGVDAAVIKADGQIHDYVMLEPIRKSATARAVVDLATLKLKTALSN